MWPRPFCLPGQPSKIVSMDSRGSGSFENPWRAAKCSCGGQREKGVYRTFTENVTDEELLCKTLKLCFLFPFGFEVDIVLQNNFECSHIKFC